MNKVNGSKKQRVLAYLEKHKTLRPFDAWVKLGVYRLSASIYSLKKLGHKIDTEIVPVRNQFDEVCRVAQYRLVASGKLATSKSVAVKPVRSQVVKQAQIRAAVSSRSKPTPVVSKSAPAPSTPKLSTTSKSWVTLPAALVDNNSPRNSAQRSVGSQARLTEIYGNPRRAYPPPSVKRY